MIGPLTCITDIAGMLLEKITSETQRHMLEMIITSSRLVLCHSSDLLDYKLLEHGTLIPHLEVNSLEETLVEVLEIAKLDLSNKSNLDYDLSNIRNF